MNLFLIYCFVCWLIFPFVVGLWLFVIGDRITREGSSFVLAFGAVFPILVPCLIPFWAFIALTCFLEWLSDHEIVTFPHRMLERMSLCIENFREEEIEDGN